MIDISLYFTVFATTIASTFCFRPVAAHLGLIDCPGGRKCHEGNVPLIGGIAMFVGVLFAMLVSHIPLEAYRSLLAGMLVMVVVGVLDDRQDLTARLRFLAQMFAALLVATWGGLRLDNLGSLVSSEVLVLGALAIPFTVFGMLGVINAFNMSDGVDGLCGSLTLSSVGLFAAAAWGAGRFTDLQVLLLLVAAVSAFLVFNFPFPGRRQAKVFMGDAGSMFLGFSLAWFAVSLTQGETRAIAPVTALWILALPLMDTVSVMVRRMLKGLSPFAPDREHFHHIFLVAGYGARSTVLIMLGISLTLGVVGLVAERLGVPEYIMFYAFLMLFALYFWGMMHAWKVMKAIRAVHHA